MGLLITISLLFAFVNLASAVRVGDWLYERVSPELTVIGLLAFCSPTIFMILWWLA